MPAAVDVEGRAHVDSPLWSLPQTDAAHSTVTLFARFLGWSTLQPRFTAM